MDSKYNPQYFRETWCWFCFKALDNKTYPECPICGWIICPECGSCRQHGCVSSESINHKHREILREMWITLPEPHPASVESWAIEQEKEIRKAEKQEREKRAAALREEYRKSLTFGRKLYHTIYGEGRVVRLQKENEKEKLIVRFPDHGEKRFNYPESFIYGGLRFEG